MDISGLPAAFPYAWASDWGEDPYGVYFGITYKGARLGFRWIPAGTFLMGSPEDEPGRWDDEALHQVTLRQGFWMGETTCTQQFWERIMGNNPSRFKGEQYPVEGVSWDEVAGFIEKVNGMKPELAFRLPTEAEWEYACRAGTQTPFWFGEQITTDQANYNGKNPYNSGEQGEYREKTMPVKSFSPNAWGLYQMHGNVLECCKDWFDTYPNQPVQDPQGPDTGRIRVMRGGGWNFNGRSVRSASRSFVGPSDGGNWMGFRLARGQ